MLRKYIALLHQLATGFWNHARYVRVSDDEGNAAQITALKSAGGELIFEEKVRGRWERPEIALLIRTIAQRRRTGGLETRPFVAFMDVSLIEASDLRFLLSAVPKAFPLPGQLRLWVTEMASQETPLFSADHGPPSPM